MADSNTHPWLVKLQEQWQRALDRNVRVAVTGLSQSGKTTFITSLIDQLLKLDARNLPLLDAMAEGRIITSQLMTLPELQVPTFPYKDFMAAIQDTPPRWPTSTDRMRGVRIAIRFRTRRAQLGAGNERTLYIDLIDYPGEWLLDLPLKTLSFQEWSRQVLEQTDEPARKALAQSWLDYVAGLDPQAPADDDQVQQGQRLYAEYLKRCKEELGLSSLQPGRFLIPGELEGSPLLWFFPLEVENPDTLPKNSLYRALENRFEAYKKQVVRGFHEELSRLDRQIVLVDVLKALNHGPNLFADMQSSIEQVLQTFNYGKSGLYSRIFNSKIDKLLFAATKADHVTDNQHHNLRLLLETMIDEAKRKIRFQGVGLSTQVLSSVRCTSTFETTHDGVKLSCLKGIPKGEEVVKGRFPGEVPPVPPSTSNWPEGAFQFVEYRLPPALSGLGKNPLPHIGIDRALNFLIGDKLE